MCALICCVFLVILDLIYFPGIYTISDILIVQVLSFVDLKVAGPSIHLIHKHAHGHIQSLQCSLVHAFDNGLVRTH